jgi:hypothetical protein
MKRLVFLTILVVFIGSCSGVRPNNACGPIDLPTPPKVLQTETKGIDKTKYPNTVWIKKPTMDLPNRRAYWDFDDVNKISQNTVDWAKWAAEVQKKIEEYNAKAKLSQQGK